MSLTIIVLEPNEDFIQFLDPDLCNLKETIEKGGLRTLEFAYKFQDFLEDKELFKLGNKIWVANDDNITNCLYVINTVVEEDVYENNSFSFTAEEVLVELNYAPLFTQTEITKDNFNIQTTNGKQEIIINWNALNYWFGDYYNIGVVQDCIRDYVQKISLSGTITRMSLLRKIEEETGNVFVTRYEKDLNDNTIHRYLDYLNPVNNQKDWVLNLEYDFINDTVESELFDGADEDGTTPLDKPESTQDIESDYDIVTFDTTTQETNITPANLIFQITDGREILNTNGKPYDSDDPTQTPLYWDNIQFPQNNRVVISLEKEGNTIGVAVNERSFAIINGAGDTNKGYIDPDSPISYETISTVIPDDCYLELYDNVNNKVLYQTQINHSIGTVHTDILEFAYNVENVKYEIDETETYTAISPILSLDANSGGTNSLSRTDMATIIDAWRNLEVSKGATVPMIVQKIAQKGTSQADAESKLGAKTITNNYWSRPYKPNDQAGSSYEFWKATAYWKAPFNKKAGEFHVRTDNENHVSYNMIMTRPDLRDSRGLIFNEKLGTVETSDEDIYAIFNDVCMKLKEKQNPSIEINIDVANLRNGKYNQYNLHDKVYVKLPDSEQLVLARVTGTEKEPHDIAKNNITISNYNIKNNIIIKDEVYIQAENTSFRYPESKTITARLINTDYVNADETPGKLQYPANKLITIAIYKNENESLTPTGKTYNKRTDANGYVKLPVKFTPGKYELEFTFAGDEEFNETVTTIQVIVAGEVTVKRKEKKKKVAAKNKKTVKKTVTKKTSNKNTKSKPVKKSAPKKPLSPNYNKYGLSPDNSSILVIGKKSSSRDNVPFADDFYESEFFNKCPICGKNKLIWSYNWANDERKTWGKFPLINANKNRNQEGLVVCRNCYNSFSALGNQISGDKHLWKTKYSTIRSDKSQAYLLKQGRIKYGVESRKERYKKFKDRPRQIIGNPSRFIRQKALSIVGDSIGMSAAKKIAAYMGQNIRYVGYSDFHKSPDTVIHQGGGNCCDQTRCMLNLMDAAGCSEYFTLKYVYVCCSGGGVGHVFARLINKPNIYGNSDWRYVDPCKYQPWGNYVRGWGSPPGSQYYYPTRPF